MRINNYSPEEYASQWGCEAKYDRLPNLPGDGNLFYAFGYEERTPDYIARLTAAIDRTIKSVQFQPDLYDADAIEGLTALKGYAQQSQVKAVA